MVGKKFRSTGPSCIILFSEIRDTPNFCRVEISFPRRWGTLSIRRDSAASRSFKQPWKSISINSERGYILPESSAAGSQIRHFDLPQIPLLSLTPPSASAPHIDEGHKINGFPGF